MFASPAITPSNNFKAHAIQSKELNQSNIQGRKMDQVQLRVKEEPRQSIQKNSPSIGISGKRKELSSLANYQRHLNELNNTNKEVAKNQQLEYQGQMLKQNATIQYDEAPKTNPKYHKPSKSMAIAQKKRQGSQSGPRHQPSASIVNSQAQPLINLHILNAKIAAQAKAVSSLMNKKRIQDKPSSAGQRSKSKHRPQKSVSKRLSMNAQSVKENIILPHSYNTTKQLAGVMQNNFFNFENKENQSINQSPSRIEEHYQPGYIMESDSSFNSQRDAIAHQLEKQYFLDKSSLLKHLSPERKSSKSKSRLHSGNQQILSDRAQQQMADASVLYKSNLSTLAQKQPLLNETTVLSNKIKGIDFSTKQLMFKNVDKLIKQNLKRTKTKEEEQNTKRKIEAFKQKIKKMELSQRNHQVRKINASKIMHAAKVEYPIQQVRQNSVIGYKKHRSKSCINKSDNLFGQPPVQQTQQPRSKERAQKQTDQHKELQVFNLEQVNKKERKREKSLFVEMKELKKQIDGEIKREILAGKLDIHPSSTANKKSNLSTINQNRDSSHPRQRKALNMSVIDPYSKNKDNSKDELMCNELKKRKSSKSVGRKSGNLKKYIEKKKTTQNAMKSLEHTIEHKKTLKMKENLKNLNSYVKQHFRVSSAQYAHKKNHSVVYSAQGEKEQKGVKKLKPQFFKNRHEEPKGDEQFEFIPHEGMFSEDQDLSRDVYDDYQRLINSIKKHKNDKVREESFGADNGQQLNQRGLREELEISAISQKKQALETSKAERHGFIRQEPVPNVVPQKNATIMPPQSDITTINKDNFDKSLFKQQKEVSIDKRPKVVSDRQHAKSPIHSHKLSNLMQMYGHILPPSQISGPSADTKLLIKLHSASITIQQHFRKHLERQGFYESELQSSDDNSQMYVDSENDELPHLKYHFDNTSDKKPYDEAQRKLIAQTSPLRMKKSAKPYEVKARDIKPINKFYGPQHGQDSEKVIVCSVITSARVEPADSNHQNSQKYIPLRQKIQPPMTESIPTSLQAVLVNQREPVKEQPKAREQLKPIPAREYAVLPREQSKADISADLSSSSRQKKLIPSLDFTRLSVPVHKEEQKAADSSNRSIFERHSFQTFSQKQGDQQFNMNNYPEMLKMREDVIKMREHEESKLLKKMVKNNQMSPRTYETKRIELETWVSKEKEEVKKTRHVFEEQWKKTAHIIEQTQKNSDFMKRMFEQPYSNQKSQSYHQESLPSEQTINPPLLTSHRQGTLNSHRDDTTHILDKISDYKTTNQPKATLQAHDLPLKSERVHSERQREQDIKKELERLREQERLEKERLQELYRQAQLKEKAENDRKLEEERQKRIEEERLRKLEEEHLKKLENERQRKLEEDRLKQIKEEQEARAERERKADEAARLVQAQQKADEEDRIKREAEERKDEERRKQEEAAFERRRQEEEEKRVLQEKKKQEDEAQRLREREAKGMELEKKRLEREAKEKKEKERLAIRAEQDKQKQELERKLAAIQMKFDSQNKAKAMEAQKKAEQKFLHQEFLEKKHDDFMDSDDFDDDFDFADKHQADILKKVLNQDMHKRGKEVLETQEDKKSDGLIDLDNIEAELPSIEHRDDEANRGLSRTRSSQYLKEHKPTEDEILSEEVSLIPTRTVITKDKSLANLDESIDEDLVAQKLLDRNFSQNDDISAAVRQEGFFSQDFDTKDASEILSGLKSFSQEKTKEHTFELSHEQSKILVKDEADSSSSILKDESVLEEPKSHSRLSQEMRDLIPVESEQIIPTGLPVSPASRHDFKIMTGAQSLESTLNDMTELALVLTEVNKTDEQKKQLEQQVDQITEDIYKELMAEFKVELDLLLITDPRRLFKEDAASHQLTESGRFVIFERRGIKTDLFAIEHYVEEVLEEVLGQKTDFIDTIQKPISKNSIEVLNQLQSSDIGSYEHFEMVYQPVLPLDLYLKLEKRRKQKREQETPPPNSQQNPGDRNFLAECEHIHNKVLFDCINDSLIQFKPYGKEGSPLPWSRQNRRLKPIEEFTVEEMFEIVKHDLFRWAIMQAGTLPRREFIFGGVFDDELFAEIREKKLATLLAREMIEIEPKWLNYEFEEAQVKIDIGDMILEQLVTETLEILKQNTGQ